MRVVLQRVSRACVRVEGEEIGAIGRGVLALVGVAAGDELVRAEEMASKIRHLRLFEDAEGKMNQDVVQVGGAVLVVSQFTLAADTRKGRRPSFSSAARPEQAEPLVGALIAQLRSFGVPVAEGRFGAKMQVELVNDGPVTLLLES